MAIKSPREKSPLQLRQLERAELFNEAKQGNKEAIAEVKQLYHAKIYTNEEIAILNTFLNKRGIMDNETQQEAEIINVRDKNAIIMLPSLNGVEHKAVINWIQHLEGDYYLASLEYIDHYPYEKGGYTEWMLKRDEEVGWLPMFCSLYW